MNKIIIFSALFQVAIFNAQVGIGTNTPDKNAILHLESDTLALVLPVVPSTQLASLSDKGALVYDDESNCIKNVDNEGNLGGCLLSEDKLETVHKYVRYTASDLDLTREIPNDLDTVTAICIAAPRQNVSSVHKVLFSAKRQVGIGTDEAIEGALYNNCVEYALYQSINGGVETPVTPFFSNYLLVLDDRAREIQFSFKNFVKAQDLVLYHVKFRRTIGDKGSSKCVAPLSAYPYNGGSNSTSLTIDNLTDIKIEVSQGFL